MRYSDQDDFLLYLLMVSKPARKPSGSGSILAVLLLVAFILYCICR